ELGVQVAASSTGYSLEATYTLNNFPTDRDNYYVEVQAKTNQTDWEKFTVDYMKDSGSWTTLGYIEGTSETTLNSSIGGAPSSSVEVRFTDNSTGSTPPNTTLKIDLIQLYCYNDTKYDLDIYYTFTFAPVPTDKFNVSIYAFYNDGGAEALSVWAWDGTMMRAHQRSRTQRLMSHLAPHWVGQMSQT
ncbi:MAG: hypothetical protein KAJ51_14755, partial [Thermoplasmata archaeon]|nr:hypothetical protein [Thermoplasmata archaeon]